MRILCQGNDSKSHHEYESNAESCSLSLSKSLVLLVKGTFFCPAVTSDLLCGVFTKTINNWEESILDCPQVDL